jgi:AcrR family transcriptional regulator
VLVSPVFSPACSWAASHRACPAASSTSAKLLATGVTPTVEQAAAAALISRTTAYRYFPSQRALLLAAHPEIQYSSLLPDDPPEDVQARLDLVMRAFIRQTIEWEPQLRTSLRLSLEPAADQPLLRGGRAIGWIEDALSSLRDTRPDLDVRQLAVAIRSATGIESLVWLTDIADLTRDQAGDLMLGSARALLHAASAHR